MRLLVCISALKVIACAVSLKKKSFLEHLRKFHRDNMQEYELDNSNKQQEMCNSSIEENISTNITFNENHCNVHDNSTNSDWDISFLEINEALKKAITSFLAKFYNISSLPRNIIQTIVEEVDKLFGLDVISKISNLILLEIKDDTSRQNVSTMLELIFNPFKNLKTEYQRQQFFFKNENYIPPLTVCLGEKLESVKTKGVKMFKNVPVIEQYVPIKLTLKQYVEFGDNFSVLQSYVHYVDTLPSDLLVNYCQ